MIRGVLAISLAAGLGIATLPFGASAKGIGVHASHVVGPAIFEGSPAYHHHHRFGYDRHGSLAVIDHPDSAAATPQVGTSNATAACSYSRVTKTVPSEEGGTREITITRC